MQQSQFAERQTGAVDRFLRYVQIDTQSDSQSTTNPSTEKQKDLSRVLVQELQSHRVVGVASLPLAGKVVAN